MYLVEKPSAHQKEYQLFRNVAFILMYSYSVWNPLICLILNVNFRSGFKTIIGTFCSCLFVSIGNFCKPKNEIAKLSSSAIDCGQELNVIQLTSINNLKENWKNDFVWSVLWELQSEVVGYDDDNIDGDDNKMLCPRFFIKQTNNIITLIATSLMMKKQILP